MDKKELREYSATCLKIIQVIVSLESESSTTKDFAQSMIKGDKSIQMIFEGKETVEQIKQEGYSQILSFLEFQRRSIKSNNVITNVELIMLFRIIDELNKYGDIIPLDFRNKVMRSINTIFV